MTTSTLPPSAEGLRERKKRRRRNQLVDAAQELVLARGLDEVTVEDICDAVGISTRTFFNYFDTKIDGVLGAPTQDLPEGAASCFAEGGPTGDLLTDAECLLRAMLRSSEVTGRLGRTMELVSREPKLLAHHARWLDERRSQLEELCTLRCDAQPDAPTPAFLALMLMTLIRATTLAWDHQGPSDPADHIAETIAQLRLLATSATSERALP